MTAQAFYDFWIGDYRVRMSDDEQSATAFLGDKELATVTKNDEASANVQIVRWIAKHRVGDVQADTPAAELPTAASEPQHTNDEPTELDHEESK